MRADGMQISTSLHGVLPFAVVDVGWIVARLSQQIELLSSLRTAHISPRMACSLSMRHMQIHHDS